MPEIRTCRMGSTIARISMLLIIDTTGESVIANEMERDTIRENRTISDTVLLRSAEKIPAANGLAEMVCVVDLFK